VKRTLLDELNLLKVTQSDTGRGEFAAPHLHLDRTHFPDLKPEAFYP